MYAEIIVDIASEQVDRVFTYQVPDTLRIVPGMRVRVPFGPREKEGFVIRLKDKADYDESKIKPILAALEDYPAVLPELMELAWEIRAKCHCPLCEALRLMLPAEMRGGRVKVKTEEYVRLLIPPERIDEAIESQKRAKSRQMLIRLLSDGQAHPVEELRPMFRDVNGDTRADCQENYPMFVNMRTSQFSAWNEEALSAYREDLRSAEGEGRNLLRDKYIHMMASTDPEGYLHFLPELPPVSEEKKALVEEIWQIMLPQTIELRRKYPNVGKLGRPLLSADERNGYASVRKPGSPPRRRYRKTASSAWATPPWRRRRRTPKDSWDSGKTGRQERGPRILPGAAHFFVCQGISPSPQAGR